MHLSGERLNHLIRALSFFVTVAPSRLTVMVA
jgi:hypothetical protein